MPSDFHPRRAAVSGIDVAAIDQNIRPQDDLYHHVNGRWLASHEIPADRAADGAFRELADQAERQVRDIITEAQDSATLGSVAESIGALYASFMDVDRVEAAGYGPLRENLDAIASASSHAELTKLLGSHQRSGGPAIAGFWVDTDRDDPTAYTLYLMQAGLGLPDEAYYREESHAETLVAYRDHIAATLARGFSAEPEVTADRIVALETAIASHHWDAVRNRDAQATHNPMSLSELVSSAPGFDWRSWADAVGIPAIAHERLIAREPDFFTGVSQVWADSELADLKSWATFHTIRKFSPYLHGAAVDLNFDFYGRVLTGATEVRERWKRGVSLVEGALGEAVGQLYVERHFPAEHKQRMDELVGNLIKAYRASIEDLDWMGPDTRKRALEKLSKFTPKIGYPDKWRDYSGLELASDDLVGNVRRSNEFDHAFELAKLTSPVDRDEWFMTPQTVNAYYNRA